MGIIYLDNAATSWPKPPQVARAMLSFLEMHAGNPGRSGHRLSLSAGRAVYEAREALVNFFGMTDPLRLVFTANATEALNLALRGLLRPGDHVVTSGMEHNAVMRPLRALEQEGVELTVAACEANGSLDPRSLSTALKSKTRLVVLNHASNVAGTINPISEVGEITQQHGILLLVDSAQTAGVLPIDMASSKIDLLAFTGHKGLLGPTGTGGLLIGERVEVDEFQPLIRGGTGSRSESQTQPDFLPDKFESGTLNAVGLAGLHAGLSYLLTRGLDDICQHENSLIHRLLAGLHEIPGIKIFGPCDPERQVAVISITLNGWSVSELAFNLDEEFGILCRPGLHCAPLAHETIGTYPEGTLRLAPGPFTKPEEIDTVLDALRTLAKRGQ